MFDPGNIVDFNFFELTESRLLLNAVNWKTTEKSKVSYVNSAFEPKCERETTVYD